MIPDDPELRHALDARSSPPSPEFGARFRNALGRGRPSTNWMPAVALVTVVMLSLSSVGVLLAARNLGHRGPGVASGGRTPSSSPTPSDGRSVVSAPSDQVVWVLVEPDHLYRSADQGTHWESRPLPGDVGVRPSISFISASVGWLLAPGSPATQCQAAPAVIWQTVDGGTTWRRLAASGLADAQCKELIYFADPQHGFVTAWDQNHRPTVYATADGGFSWSKSVLPDGPLFVTQAGGFTLRVGWIRSFGSTVYLEASGAQDEASWHQRDFIFTSTDGGATWSWKQKLASGYTSMVTESRWLQLAPDVEETVNGGQQFHPYDSNFRANTPRAEFATAEVGYATDGINVLRTVDGGAHWAAITPGATPTPPPSPWPVALPTEAYLSAPSTDVVWAFVDFRLLFISRDRGQTWELRQLPVPAQGGAHLSFSFVDAENGWALVTGGAATQCQAAGAQVWRTSDGAQTWHVVLTVEPPDGSSNGLAAAQCKQSISFVDTTHGFVTAWDPSSPPTIYRTADGGSTWKASRLPDPPGFKTSAGGALVANEVRRFGTTLLVGASGMQPSGDKGYVFKSVDGGATWRYAATLPDPPLDVAFATESRWLQLALPGQSRETTDAGRTWHDYASDYQQAAPVAPQVVFGDALVGYATVRGDLKRTDDGGAHWFVLATPGTAGPPEIPAGSDAQLSAPSPNVVWAVVANQFLFRSTDGGNTWQKREFPDSAVAGGVTMVSFLDAKRGWAMFEGTPTGTCERATVSVWRTTDGAATWQQVAHVYGKPGADTPGLTLSQCKDFLMFADDRHGFVVGFDINHRPTLFRSSDGGQSWSGSTMPDVGGGIGYSVVEMKAFGSTVIAVGVRSADFYFFRSTDGGATWTYMPGTLPAAPSYVSLLSPTHWVMVQAGAQTSDAGKTWQAFASDYPTEATGGQVWFASEIVGFATNRGVVYRTIDGGAHWSAIKTSWP